MVAHDRIQAIGDEKIGADGAMSIGGGDGQGAQPVVVQETLADVDGLSGTGRVEQDIRTQKLCLQPLGIGPGNRGGAVQVSRRVVPAASLASRPGQPKEQAEPMVACRPDQGYPVDCFAGVCLPGGLLVLFESELVTADGLGRAGKPKVIGRAIGRQRNIVLITLDQPAVLAEDDHPIGLRDDQVAVPRDQVAPLGMIGRLQLDRWLGAQTLSADRGPGSRSWSASKSSHRPRGRGRTLPATCPNRARHGAACRS